MQELIERLVAAADLDVIIGPIMMTQMQGKRQSDGNYRTVPVNAGTEMMFKGAREGARGKIIFEFKPVDPEYIQLELAEDKVFQVFDPSFEEKIVQTLHPGFTPNSWNEAKSWFFQSRVAEVKRNEKEREEREREEAISRHKNNPTWGMF